ncbi:MAG: sigma-70 family RNA polymerase sigma factor [Acidimicrobiia bacterium]|nr:sigma-70 family RNA polymerase sigma factor [Acidimicrobiia bacterium]
MQDFDGFLLAHYEPVRRALALALGDVDRAEDVTQEAFARAYRRWSSVAAMDRPVAWVYVVAMNQARHELRRERRPTPAASVPVSTDVAGTVATTLALDTALKSLPPRQRAAVVLRYLADLSTAQVADAALRRGNGEVDAAHGPCRATHRDGGGRRMTPADLQRQLHEIAAEVPPSHHDPSAVVASRVRRHRRRVWTVTTLTVVVALVAASAALWATGRGTHVRHVVAGPSPTPGSATAEQLARFHWSDLPPAPIPPRDDASIVWTGHELLVWGGEVNGPKATPKSDGAAFDPASNRWRPIAAPTAVAQRGQALTLWTGQEMLVIGGLTSDGVAPSNDGAYDPTTDHWRTLPPRPLGMTGALTGAWDGHEALVLSLSGTTTAYDPSADTWRSMPPLPEPGEQEVVIEPSVWAGEQFLVWAEWQHNVANGNVVTGYSGIDLWSLDPTSGTWKKLGDRATDPSFPGGPQLAIWTGTEVVLPGAGQFSAGFGGGPPPVIGPTGSRYDPSTNAYRPLGEGPINGSSLEAVWTGGALVRTMLGPIAFPPQGTPTTQPSRGTPPPRVAVAWDPASNTWTTLPSPPSWGFNRQLIWTGREILSYGQDGSFRFGP